MTGISKEYEIETYGKICSRYIKSNACQYKLDKVEMGMITENLFILFDCEKLYQNSEKYSFSK